MGPGLQFARPKLSVRIKSLILEVQNLTHWSRAAITSILLFLHSCIMHVQENLVAYFYMLKIVFSVIIYVPKSFNAYLFEFVFDEFHVFQLQHMRKHIPKVAPTLSQQTMTIDFTRERSVIMLCTCVKLRGDKRATMHSITSKSRC